MPLEPLVAHIEDLINRSYEGDLKPIPFSHIRLMSESAISSHINGLRIIKSALTESLIKKAEVIAQTKKTKSGKAQAVEQVIYTYYQDRIRDAYRSAERLNTDISMLVKTGIRPELYYWLLEVAESFGAQTTIVFKEGERFIVETFEQRITDPINSFIELAKRPDVDGSLVRVASIDLTKLYPIETGYIVSCVRGEAQNPSMWPILCHEMFELVDKEIGIFQRFTKFVSETGKNMPVLDPIPETNRQWSLEILMDFLAMTSFGPMYAKALLEYCKRSPYYPTPQCPEMCVRLFCSFLYLLQPVEDQTDIFVKCQRKAKQEIEPEILTYEENGELEKEKKDKLTMLFGLMMMFLETIKAPSFLDRLRRHVEESANPKTTLGELMKSESQFIRFKDPVLAFDDIRNNVLYHNISLAIDPNIMLNVVLANYDVYRKEKHLSILLDSIKKWKVKQAWNHSVSIVASV